MRVPEGHVCKSERVRVYPRRASPDPNRWVSVLPGVRTPGWVRGVKVLARACARGAGGGIRG